MEKLLSTCTSRFNIVVVVLSLGMLLLFSVAFYQFYLDLAEQKFWYTKTAFIMLLLIFGLTWNWLLFVEIRNKGVKVEIDLNNISARKFFGLGIKRTYPLSQLDGYYLSYLPSDLGPFEYLYVMKGKRKVIKLSEFYHYNYSDMKLEIEKHLKFLGELPYSTATEMLEIFE